MNLDPATLARVLQLTDPSAHVEVIDDDIRFDGTLNTTDLRDLLAIAPAIGSEGNALVYGASEPDKATTWLTRDGFGLISNDGSGWHIRWPYREPGKLLAFTSWSAIPSWHFPLLELDEGE